MIVRFIIIHAAMGAMILAYLLFTGPHMKVQQNIRAYDTVMPVPPPNMVPVTPTDNLPTAAQANDLRNPLPNTPDNIARGRVYYSYYCVQCHGENGMDVGPVGESYVPRPTDLRSPKVQSYSDGQLLRAMFAGVGHEPVLWQTVLPEHRWYLVLYTRSLGEQTSPVQPR